MLKQATFEDASATIPPGGTLDFTTTPLHRAMDGLEPASQLTLEDVRMHIEWGYAAE